MRLLVITHEATRSGAPILLLNLLKAYKKRTPGLYLDIIISKSGPLDKDFKDISNRTLLLKRPVPSSNFRIYNFLNKFVFGVLNKDGFEERIRNFVLPNYNFILSNTITNGPILHALRSVKGPIISYIHELETIIRSCTTPENLVQTLTYTDKFIVPSVAVKENLVVNHKVSPLEMKQLKYYVPDFSGDIYNSVKVDNEFIIGCIGTLEWRKGADIFLKVVKLFSLKQPLINVKFIWVGVEKASKSYKEFIHDINNAGLVENIILIEKTDKPLDYLASMDIFLLLSREDPYPLVVLEAAMLSKPIICFEKAGGAAEFLIQETGIVVPYLDIDAVVEALLELLLDESLRTYYGVRARAAYLQKHSEDVALNNFESVLDEFKVLRK